MDEDKNDDDSKTTFKMPILVGKVGRLPRKTVITTTVAKDEFIVKDIVIDKEQKTETDTPDTGSNEEEIVEPTKDSGNVLKYEEPLWAGLPIADIDYNFEVLKSGVIIDKINLMAKSFWIFGRLQTCDVYMAHPTISRFHAVLQYKSVATTNEKFRPGFYIYDLGSSHGTFLNKNRIKPKMYVRVNVGHMLKLGCSTRTYLLTGPENDTETESDLTVTQLKEKRVLDLKQREEAKAKELQEVEDAKKKEETRGIDWGMGEDADEETDLSENPFAETNNEQLYIEDPKKALRGFFEREGLELHYECNERGLGQFLCSVVLPVDDARGRPVVAEALVKGKKKEAVVQCALEACRILDRHGILRQATHESRKRKAKNWEENDFYDSDDDTFLDRTGTIERKREKRMQAKQPNQPETYQSLLSKEQDFSKQVESIEKQLANATSSGSSQNSSSTDNVDPLDRFMTELSSHKSDKFLLLKLKTDLARIRKERADIIKLINIARPAHLPPLVMQGGSAQDTPSTSGTSQPPKKVLPIFGKRLKVKVTLPAREPPKLSLPEDPETDVSDEEEEVDAEQENVAAGTSEVVEDSAVTRMDTEVDVMAPMGVALMRVTPRTRKGIMKQLERKVARCDETALASLDEQVKAKISKTVTKLRKIAEEEESIVVEQKRLAVQKKKIYEQMNNAADSMDIEKQFKLSTALTKMTNDFCDIGERKLKIVSKINKLADDINNIAIEIKAASQIQHVEAVNHMKEFVEKAYKQQTEIFGELEKLENYVADQKVIETLKQLYEWLSNQKTLMLDNLERLKTEKFSDDPKMLDDIIEFEANSDKFVKTILKELRKIRLRKKESDKTVKTPLQTEEQTVADNEPESSEDAEKRKKKNLRRIQQRQEKAEAEKKKQYEEDAQKEDYNMWVPPNNQTGDGRTTLNDKLGY